MYAHPQARARRRTQLIKITIHQLFHYRRLRQCYRVPFRLVIYRSYSSDFDGFSYLPKHSVTVVNPSHIHHIVWDYPVMAIVRMSSQHRLRNVPIHAIQMFLSSRESTSCCFSNVFLLTCLTLDLISHAKRITRSSTSSSAHETTFSFTRSLLEWVWSLQYTFHARWQIEKFLWEFSLVSRSYLRTYSSEKYVFWYPTLEILKITHGIKILKSFYKLI